MPKRSGKSKEWTTWDHPRCPVEMFGRHLPVIEPVSGRREPPPAVAKAHRQAAVRRAKRLWDNRVETRADRQARRQLRASEYGKEKF